MFRAFLSRLLGTETGDAEDGSEDVDSDSGFVPSRLDASVLHGHGAEVAPETDGDVDELEERAREAERKRLEG